MKVLVLSPQNPYPAVDGGKLGILSPVLALCELGHSVGIFFPHCDSALAAQSLSFLKSRNIEAYPYAMDTSDSLTRVIANIGRRTPFKMAKYFDRGALEFVMRAVEDFRPDVIQAQHAHTGRYALELKERFGIPFVLREHNIEYMLVEQYSRSVVNPLLKLVALWQHFKTRRYEVGLWKRCDRVVFISPGDRERAIGEAPGIRSDVVPDGVHQKFSPEYAGRQAGCVIFSGNLATIQNLESVLWLIRDIWPIVREGEPAAKLYLTGGGEDILLDRLRLGIEQLHGRGVFPLGFVDDIDATISGCRVFVSPTLMGSGIRIKVLHAMALGMPVVCTPLDADSIMGARHDEHLFVAADCAQFAAGVLKLFSDSGLRKRLGANARRLVESEHTWEKCGRALARIYEEIIER